MLSINFLLINSGLFSMTDVKGAITRIGATIYESGLVANLG
jgi:hypothetical protein